MTSVKINRESILNSEGRVFKNRLEMFKALFDGIAEEHEKTIKRNGKEYRKTCIKPRYQDYLMSQVKTYCQLHEMGSEYVVHMVYRDRLN